VLPSEYVPVALNETFEDTETDATLGETDTPVSVAGVVEPPVPLLAG
jgi:hypothetical protein